LPVSREFVHFIQDLVDFSSHNLDLSQCPGLIEARSEISFDLTPVTAALRHDTYFTTLQLDNAGQKDIVMHVANIVRHNTRLQSICLSNLDNSKYFSVFGDMVASNSEHTIQSMTLAKCKIPNDGIDSISRALAFFPHRLRVLNLSGCQLSGKRAEMLISAFERNYGMSLGIEVLDLSHNRFDDDGSKALERWLHNAKEHSRLRSLNVADANLNMTSVARSFRSLRALEHLDISGNKIDLGASQLLGVTIDETRILRTLNCSDCDLKIDLVQSVVLGLVSNPNLRDVQINLANNPISSRDIPLLAAALRKSTNLHTLDLGGVKLKPDAFIQLLKALVKAQTLDTLLLDRTYCNVEHAKVGKSLAAILKHVPSIKALSLRGGYSRVLPDFLAALAANDSLIELDLSNNQIADAGAFCVAAMLRCNRALQLLICDRNDIGLPGWASVRLSFRPFNRSLVALPYPWIDMGRYISSVSQESTKQTKLRSVLADIQASVATNTATSGERQYVLDRRPCTTAEQNAWWSNDTLAQQPPLTDVPEALLELPEHIAMLQDEARARAVLVSTAASSTAVSLPSTTSSANTASAPSSSFVPNRPIPTRPVPTPPMSRNNSTASKPLPPAPMQTPARPPPPSPHVIASMHAAASAATAAYYMSPPPPSPQPHPATFYSGDYYQPTLPPTTAATYMPPPQPSRAPPIPPRDD
jgi:Ran GTPase-activating protein (RanGAP) involved in mRNA processing and transport